MESPAAHPERLPWRRSPGLAAALGWLVPGLGQLYVGRPGKALLFLLGILPLFLVGWALTDFTIVAPGRHRLDFLAQMFLGGPTLAAWALTAERALVSMPPLFESGRLFVQVAGLLNLVAISDAMGEAIAHNRRRLDVAATLRASARQASEEAEAAARIEAAAGVAEAEADPAHEPFGLLSKPLGEEGLS